MPIDTSFDNSSKRAQVLREFRRQIDAMGVAGITSITMRDLALSAGVATKTLYNLFGSKDALVAETVRDTYRSVIHQIAEHDGDLAAFDCLLAYVTASARFNLSEPVYSRAMIYAYYSTDVSLASVHRDFHDYIGGAFQRLLADMRRKGEINRWSPPPVVARMIVESMISTVAEWTRNVLRDDELVDASLLAVLSLLLPHLAEPRATAVKARIRALSKKFAVAEPQTQAKVK
jgi:AcrR family transcriptional regulator